ncbi:MAG: DUF2058 family protein [Deltaproteobacteria bacterium]|nr:DUF2058 family protein [Deltaproteobacteria bacterium]
MQSLRDKLLKAGAVSKAEARKSRTEVRKKKKKGRKGHDETLEKERQRKEAFEAKREEEAGKVRAQQEALNAERARTASQARLRDIIEGHVWRKTRGDDQVFHFVGLSGRICRFHTNTEVAEKLSSGQLGIVAAPYDHERDYRVVLPEVLERLAQEAPKMVLFWNDKRKRAP